jgi:anti-sigma factor RsiW
MNCHESEQHLQKLLDGGDDVPEIVTAHLAICPECRELFSAARLLLKGLQRRVPVLPPKDLTKRIADEAILQRRAWQRRRRVSAVLAIAATVLVAVGAGYLWYTSPPQAQDTVPVASSEQKPAPVPAPSDEALAGGPGTIEAATRSIAIARRTVSSGLEPVTSSGRRAVSLFLREIEPPQSDEKGGS